MYGILREKCPKCQEGNLFINKNPYKIKNMGKLNKQCSECGLHFTPEPGFYFGASYVSYALSVAISMGVFFALFPHFGWKHTEIYLTVIAGILLLLSPVLLRISRTVWISFFYRYDAEAPRRHKEKRA